MRDEEYIDDMDLLDEQDFIKPIVPKKDLRTKSM
jgi:hypothetical protein